MFNSKRTIKLKPLLLCFNLRKVLSVFEGIWGDLPWTSSYQHIEWSSSALHENYAWAKRLKVPIFNLHTSRLYDWFYIWTCCVLWKGKRRFWVSFDWNSFIYFWQMRKREAYTYITCIHLKWLHLFFFINYEHPNVIGKYIIFCFVQYANLFFVWSIWDHQSLLIDRWGEGHCHFTCMLNKK